MEIELIVTLLKDHANLSEVSRATGLHRQHLHKIKRGERRNLQIQTINKLLGYFSKDSLTSSCGGAMPTAKAYHGD